MEAIRQRKPDLVLTDICMPYVDGIELARYIFENCPDTRTIIISGYDEFEYAKQAVRYQVMEYILKPITPSELTGVLLKAKERLEEERAKRTTLKKLKGAYQSNRPLFARAFPEQSSARGRGNGGPGREDEGFGYFSAGFLL